MWINGVLYSHCLFWLTCICACFTGKPILTLEVYCSINHSVLSTVRCSPLQSEVPQTLLQRFGVAAMRGVARNRGIAEFQLQPRIREQKVLYTVDILAQLTPDDRRKFRVVKDFHPYIELCQVGEWTTFNLLMQCLCCVSQSVGRTSSLLCEDHIPPVGGGGPFLHE